MRRDAVAAVREILLSYAQVVFSRSPLVGALLLLATAVSQRALCGGLLGVAAASATALLLDLDHEARRDGAYGYNALLLGLGVAQSFAGTAPLLFLVLCAVPACTLLTAALRAHFAASGLPALSWPFLVIFVLLLGAAPAGGVLPAAAHPILRASMPGFLDAIDLFLRALGALFFLPRPETGALLLLGLLIHSRIATLLAAGAFAGVAIFCAPLFPAPETALVTVLGYNAAFTAIALGGVWFVPSPSSFLLALFGVVFGALVAAGAAAPLGRIGIPVMVLPFNATLLVVLLALRQRTLDRRPKSVDFLPGTPEENLTYLRTRLLRFRWLYPLRLRLPFRGAWLCTQGVDGAFTHQGRWRHAHDFEVRGADGLLFRLDGTLAEHYHAYRLPVVAAAAGTVMKVVNHVPDNPIGDLNLMQNWGNIVLIQHAPGLCSLVAHLLCGSVQVVEGQFVRQGDLLGLCGNSGRSPQPHIHFHLQPSAKLGEGTLPCRFNDVVALRSGKAPVLETSMDPQQGEETRNLLPAEEAAGYLGFVLGETWVMRAEAGAEHLTCEVDLHGRRLLRSREHGATLYYELGEDFFTVYDVLGKRRSMLHLFRAALPRVPLELNPTLRWRDHLPARPFRAWHARALADFVSPFLLHDGIEVELHLLREGALLVVQGESLSRDRAGVPIIRTKATLAPGGGLLAVEVTVRGRRAAAERVATTTQTHEENQR